MRQSRCRSPGRALTLMAWQSYCQLSVQFEAVDAVSDSTSTRWLRSWQCSAGVDWNTSTSPRRRYTQTSEVEAVQHLSSDSCHISAYYQHTNVDADCTSRQAAICPLYIARTVSVRGPIIPCGTPHRTSVGCDSDLQQRINWVGFMACML